jgi:hypothetical protein
LEYSNIFRQFSLGTLLSFFNIGLFRIIHEEKAHGKLRSPEIKKGLEKARRKIRYTTGRGGGVEGKKSKICCEK